MAPNVYDYAISTDVNIFIHAIIDFWWTVIDALTVVTILTTSLPVLLLLEGGDCHPMRFLVSRSVALVIDIMCKYFDCFFSGHNCAPFGFSAGCWSHSSQQSTQLTHSLVGGQMHLLPRILASSSSVMARMRSALVGGFRLAFKFISGHVSAKGFVHPYS